MKSKRGKRKDSIYVNFKKSLEDLSKIKYYFWFSFFLFFIVSIIGLIFPNFFEEGILSLLGELINQTRGLDTLELIAFIMNNNIQSAFMGVLLGLFLGVIPLVIIITNAYILGFVANRTIAAQGVSILWRLLPHGIFEIPAILISVALGLWIGNFFFNRKVLRRLYYFIASSFIFIGKVFLLVLLIYVILLVSGFTGSPEMLSDKIVSIIANPLISMIFLIFIITSFYLGTFVLGRKDKEELFENVVVSLRIFVFIVIPLLVIAGIIEGLLIGLLS